MKHLSHCSQRDVNPGSPECEAGFLTTQPECSVISVGTFTTHWSPELPSWALEVQVSQDGNY
jgi:hypothetical protein